MTSSPKLHQSWLDIIGGEFDKPYMTALRKFLADEKDAGKKIFPPGGLIFNALNTTPFDNVKVVIIGQDPYHDDNQAHGLCFSVLPPVPFPPSLRNIFKEIQDDLGYPIPRTGDLTKWAEQGVLLLNASLTVEAHKAGSHQGKGWEVFTDAVIHALNERREHIVFILWGAYAQKKGAFIDKSRHCVLEAVHPSPLSAHRGFFGCKHFSKANEYLKQNGQTPINWNLAG